MFRSGDQIGPYTLISKLGRGAFGTVWLSERRTLIATTTAALKIPLDDDVDLETIRREASLWVRASGHPNVLPIIEANIYDDQIVIASEYAPDGSLESWLKQHGKAPSVKAAVDIISGVLAGLEHLHARNIIHRDLKPANILFQGSTPRLADFGISRVLKSTGQSSVVAGTPAYMAPEAFDGKRNGQTDLWSVGVILYQLFAGRLPFPQTDITSLVGAILSRKPEPLPMSVPASLQEVIAHTLSKEPSKRFQTVAEMRDALQQPQAQNPRVRYQQKSTATIGSAPADTTPPESTPLQAVPQRRSPHLIYAGAGLIALLIIVIGLIVMLRTGPNNNSSTSSTSKPTSNTSNQVPKPSQKQETKVITVDAQAMWTDSNILLNRGDEITIDASGQVNGDIAPGFPAHKWVGPDGWGAQSPTINPGSKLMWVLGRNSSYMCLTARIENGRPFKVGSHYSFTPNSSGYLYFGVNDELLDENGNRIYDASSSGTWRNNGGAFTVKVNRIFSE